MLSLPENRYFFNTWYGIKREDFLIGIKGYFQHPSRLPDVQIKELLILDAKYNQRDLDIQRLEKMIFYI